MSRRDDAFLENLSFDFGDENANAPRGAHASPFQSDGQGSFGTDGRVRKKRRRSHKRKARKKAIIIVGCVIVAALLAFGAFAGVSAFKAKDKAAAAVAKVSSVQTALLVFDGNDAAGEAQELRTIAAELKEELSGPIWTVCSVLPVLGDDVKYAQTLSTVLDSLSADALIPLADAMKANNLSDLVKDGTVNLQMVSSLSKVVAQVSPVLNTAADQLAHLPKTHFASLSAKVNPVVEKFESLNDLLQGFAPVLDVVPVLLGSGGDRVYLLAAQNSAEIRSTGGFPGSVGYLKVSGGHIELGDFMAAYSLKGGLPESKPLTAAENELFNKYGWMDSAYNAGYSPDFPRVAEAWAVAYERTTGVSVDGVIAVTPSVVQDILAIVGEIALSDGTVLNGTNATKILQHDLYWKYLATDEETIMEGNAKADALFEEAAKLTFAKILQNMSTQNLVKFAQLAQDAVGDHRVLFWLSNQLEQGKISAFNCSGALSSDTLNPVLGVYLNCRTGSKLGWYFDANTTVGIKAKGQGGATTYAVTSSFTNAITQEEIDKGNWYIAGGDLYKPGDSGDMYPFIYLVAPAGGTISDLKVNGFDDFQTITQEYNGLQVVLLRAPSIPAGKTLTCTYTVTVAPGAVSDLKVFTTPTLTEYRK